MLTKEFLFRFGLGAKAAVLALVSNFFPLQVFPPSRLEVAQSHPHRLCQTS